MGLFDQRTGGLITYWRSVSAITALVGSATSSRIWPGMAKQGQQAPFITFTRGAGGDVFRDLQGAIGTRASIVHVYCWGETASDADALAEVVKRYTQDGHARGTWAGTYINWVYVLDSTLDGFDPPNDASDDKKYWTRLVLKIVHNEAT